MSAATERPDASEQECPACRPVDDHPQAAMQCTRDEGCILKEALAAAPVAARRQRFVKQAGVMRYVSFADGAIYVEWGDGVMVHLFRRVGLRFRFKVWRIK